jgi:hypothetical protein
MKNPPSKVINLALYLFVVIFQLSCSKDSDLLADYVISKSPIALVKVQVITIKNEPVIIEPFAEGVEGYITAISEPVMGTAVITEENTITYTPATDEVGTDEISYTVETTTTDSDSDSNSDSEETLTSGTGSIKVTTVNSEIEYWQAKFDADTSGNTNQTNISNSGDAWDLYYFDVSPHVYMFQVTGEDSYMDFGVQLFEKVMSKSINVPGGYKGWLDAPGGVAHNGGGDNNVEINLSESRGMRTVSRMLWVLSKSPTYLSKGSNQAKYDNMLTWFQRNIWDKWESRGSHHFYRSHTHMSSHWGQMAWFLHEITGKQKYRDVYIGWSSGIAVGKFKDESMRGQLREIDVNGSPGYIWAGPFGNMSSVNDVSHANAEVELMVLGAEMDDYWTLEDMEKIVRTFDQLIFKNNKLEDQPYRLDGSGSARALYDQGWVQLGRFSEALQTRLKDRELVNVHNYKQTSFANMAYNRAYLEGSLFYPEQ